MIMSSDAGQKPNRLAHEKSPSRARLNNWTSENPKLKKKVGNRGLGYLEELGFW
jgi:hypothetical protein